MNRLIKSIRAQINFLWQKVFFEKVILKNEPWILSRCACLGNDVYKKLPIITERFNIQKGRADYLMTVLSDNTLVPRPAMILKFLYRKDILSLIFQQKNLSILRSKKSPDLVYMDSYSELTDQLFVHKEKKWMFCANYTDLLTKDQIFLSKFNCIGLIPLEDIRMHYEFLFAHLRKMYKNTPILFIHFPTLLDDREKFKQRGEAILKAIGEIKHKFEPFYEVIVSSSVIDFNEADRFPYHFNDQTYAHVAAQISQLGIFAEKGLND